MMFRLCNRIVEYSFYLLFLLTPLAFTSSTSELFEFNKMWVVFGFTIVITASWLIKMIAQKRFIFKRTPLDIPILIFLLSQFISSIASLDSHISFWGYYTRFNGGFLSILSYILLYYAFVSNFTNPRNINNQQEKMTIDGISMVKRVLKLSLISGLIVALWGLPSHFGYDPTCLLFRGNLDVSCWTDAFQPKIRIFSTLGQPNWLAAYLAILIPVAISFMLKNLKSKYQFQVFNFQISTFSFYFLLLIILFFVDLLFSASRSGFLGLVIGLFVFFSYLIYLAIRAKTVSIKYVSLIFVILTSFSLFIGTPITPKIGDLIKTNVKQDIKQTNQKPNTPQGPALEVGGTESGKIRKIVWTGAIDIFKNYPILGSGVETFAFAYYKYRPVSHNLTSEWDYLYNKAHNEYLNYLATTGTFGLGSYLAIIVLFLFLVLKNLKNQISKIKNIDHNSKIHNNQLLTSHSGFDLYTLSFALLAAYISILISNFFGFSVVMTNLYLFLIPAFVFILLEMTNHQNEEHLVKQNPAPRENEKSKNQLSLFRWSFISFIILTGFYLTYALYRFWLADTNYALGYNLDRAGAYDQAYPKLKEAISLRDSEPVFKDELAINSAVLAINFANQQDATQAAIFAQQAIELNNQIVEAYPQNLVFWKTRARIFYTLSQANNQYLIYALQALEKANFLAPTDAKIAYNLGVLYGQTNNLQKGMEVLEKTIILKPDYRDAYYALGLFYREQAIDKNGKIKDPTLQKKAVETMNNILIKFATDDAQAIKTLKDWGEL